MHFHDRLAMQPAPSAPRGRVFFLFTLLALGLFGALPARAAEGGACEGPLPVLCQLEELRARFAEPILVIASDAVDQGARILAFATGGEASEIGGLPPLASATGASDPEPDDDPQVEEWDSDVLSNQNP